MKHYYFFILILTFFLHVYSDEINENSLENDSKFNPEIFKKMKTVFRSIYNSLVIQTRPILKNFVKTKGRSLNREDSILPNCDEVKLRNDEMDFILNNKFKELLKSLCQIPNQNIFLLAYSCHKNQ